MMRKLFAALLVLALAGGVYLSTGDEVQASNMGFKLEREFRTIQGYPGLYYVSFPLFNGLGDVADTRNANPCAAGGDGVINADDAICDMWDVAGGANRKGPFSMSRFDSDSCSFQTRTCNTIFGNVSCVGGWTGALPRDEGFQVNAPFVTANGAVSNRAVIVGSDDPSYTGRTLRIPASNCRPNYAVLNLPYHTMYQNALEVLCGLENVDWERRTDGCPGPMGNPESARACPNGIFDGAAQISVNWFKNDGDLSAGDNTFLSCIANVVFGNVNFPAGCTCYDLRPGDAYLVVLTPLHTPTTFLSPHF